MPRSVSVNTLNGSTMDIMNVIRANASWQYQTDIPEVTQVNDIPKVGAVIYGHPAHANQFINALINRIAIHRIQSATFNNPYAHLKKGYVNFGETIEEIFVGIAKAIDYSPNKATEREFKRTMPDVHAVFHIMNWRVIYPITIQDEDLKLAFTSDGGVQNLIAKIVEQVYTGAEYDEFLLFKYLLIKAVAHNKMYKVNMTAPANNARLNYQAEKYRGYSNMIMFMNSKYNESGVKTTTPRDRQVIFMDAMYNAKFDVEQLSAAFHMDKTDFMGRLHLIDDFTSFDNDRFEVIRENSDGLEEVTADELSAMANVKAMLLDENWFQVYDNNNKFTENYMGSSLYWNYWYHVWKTISYSPFANALVFIDEAAGTLPDTAKYKVTEKVAGDGFTAYTLTMQTELDIPVKFVQTQALTALGIAITPYGVMTIPDTVASAATIPNPEVLCDDGTTYSTTTAFDRDADVGTEVTLNKLAR